MIAADIRRDIGRSWVSDITNQNNGLIDAQQIREDASDKLVEINIRTKIQLVKMSDCIEHND